MARIRSRWVSGRAIMRMTRAKSETPGRRACGERRELRWLGSRGLAAGKVLHTGKGYEPPRRASVAAMPAEVRHAAGVDKGMVVIEG